MFPVAVLYLGTNLHLALRLVTATSLTEQPEEPIVT